VLNWSEVPPEVLGNMLSTGQAEPLAREAWPAWARTPKFSGAWFSYVGGPLATSTGTLSTGNVQGYVDVERTAERPPSLRYDRHFYVKMTDGRVFHAGLVKDLEYGHHLEQRPQWLASYVTRSTSTG